MNNKIFILLIFIIIQLLSCTEDYNSLPDINSKTLMVNGCVTNERGPYRIQLSEDIAGGNMVKSYPVSDARLTITDDLGNVDELKPLWEEEVVMVEKEGIRFPIPHYYFLMPNYAGGYDSVLISTAFLDIKDYFFGTYYTTSTVGRPGGTYTLDIAYDSRTFSATDQMPYPAVIDSIVVRDDGSGIEGKGFENFELPYLYFKKPEHKDTYFLFTFKQYEWHPMWGIPIQEPETFERILFESSQKSWATWNYAAVSGRLMSSYVSGFKITGATSIPWVSGTDQGWYEGVRSWAYADFYMVSVSRSACMYFQSLADQFYQDGGAFSPSPSSPPTNLTNGAQGFFMAAAVEQKRIFK